MVEVCSELLVREELERLLTSREFATAERAARFLKYAVDRSLAGDRDGLKESIIGSAVFDRPPGYDLRAEPIVRTEARRLRGKLEKFYSARHDSQVRISIPKGSYLAVFEANGNCHPAIAEAVPVDLPATLPNAPPIHRSSPHWGWAAAAAALLFAGLTAAWFILRESRSALPVLTTVTSFAGGQFSPSLSPDGTQVAFVWRREGQEMGSIYSVSVDGGQPTRITTDAAGDTSPVWSPDGNRLAFIRRGKGILTAGAHGGNERFLAPAFPTLATWSPDGARIVYCGWTQTGERIALFSADSMTGSHRQISDPPAGSIGDLTADFSPDGRQVAFARCGPGNCDVYIMPSEGGQPRRLARGEAQFSGLTWSPDGRTIVFSARRSGQFQLWQADARGSDGLKLISATGEGALFPRFGRNLSGPSRLVYEQHIDDSNIWEMKLDQAGVAGEPHRLIASTRLDSSPQVSPDGRKIVFVSDRSGYDEIWTADLHGSDATEVTHMRGQAVGSPRWSPDSQRLAFDVVSTAGRSIFVVDAAGGTPRQWGPWARAGRPSWSRDGRWIYFGDHEPSGVSHVFKISTTDERQSFRITDDGGFEAYESIDGKWLFYLHDHELRRMPVNGGAWSKVTDHPVYMGLWSVAANGIYFVDIASARRAGAIARGEKPVYFLDSATGALRRVATIKGDMNANLPDFCVSPDGRNLYYGWLEVSVSQIRMIEGGF